MNSLRTIVGLFLATTVFAADVIPDARKAPATWAAAGVPGGIWQYRARTVVAITGLDTTGTNDSSAVIQAAINSAAPDTALVLPAGILRLNSGVTVNKDRVTLRGAGMGATILMCHGAASVGVSGQATSSWNYPPGIATTSAAAAGASALTVNDATDLIAAAGLQAQILVPNDRTLSVVHVSGHDRSRLALVRLTGGSGNTFTFTPALPFAVPSGTVVVRETGNSVNGSCYRVGLEDLTVNTLNSTAVFTTGLGNARESWFYNVEAVQANNYNSTLGFAIQCSIIHCRFVGRKGTGGTNGAALLVGQATACLIEDNILASNFPCIEINSGTFGNVFAYNLLDDSVVFGTIGGSLNTNHGPHNSFNLYEGNITPRFQCDGYFGGASEDTVFRNWIHGTNGPTFSSAITGKLAVTLNRFTRRYNIVANQLGRTAAGVTWNYANVARGFNTTSATSMNPTTGVEVTGVVIGTGLAYRPTGTHAIFYSASDPTRWVVGEIYDYNSGTGSCRLVNTRAGGSGTKSDWIVVGGGGYGDDSTSGYIYALGGPNIGNGGFLWHTGGVVAPQSLGIWWKVWDGRAMVRRGAYNSGTAYAISGTGPNGTADVVDYVADGSSALAGGNSILQWIAANPAKNGAATWAPPGKAQSDWLPISPNSFQELDYDVYGTALLKGNWNAADNTVPSNEALGNGETYPKSYYLGETAPAFFGTLAWPPFNPTSPNQSFTAIPAGYRYMNPGQEAPGYTPPAPTATNRMPTITPVQSVVQ